MNGHELDQHQTRDLTGQFLIPRATQKPRICATSCSATHIPRQCWPQKRSLSGTHARGSHRTRRMEIHCTRLIRLSRPSVFARQKTNYTQFKFFPLSRSVPRSSRRRVDVEELHNADRNISQKSFSCSGKLHIYLQKATALAPLSSRINLHCCNCARTLNN